MNRKLLLLAPVVLCGCSSLIPLGGMAAANLPGAMQAAQERAAELQQQDGSLGIRDWSEIVGVGLMGLLGMNQLRNQKYLTKAR